jgi:hypothetical protein
MRAAHTLIAVAIAAAVVAATACAHADPGARRAIWQLRGAIVAVDDHSTIRVRHKSGQIVEVGLDRETTFVSGGQPTDATALHAGARVVIDVEPLGDGRQRARRVRVFSG